MRHHQVAVNDLTPHVAEEGDGPLVVLLHGFPETWYSWRHQFGPLADAGYRVVAPDMRGYGGTDRPADVGQYTILDLRPAPDRHTRTLLPELLPAARCRRRRAGRGRRHDPPQDLHRCPGRQHTQRTRFPQRKDRA